MMVNLTTLLDKAISKLEKARDLPNDKPIVLTLALIVDAVNLLRDAQTEISRIVTEEYDG
jgi:hypothetical protein